jgi:hypothetical protein
MSETPKGSRAAASRGHRREGVATAREGIFAALAGLTGLALVLLELAKQLVEPWRIGLGGLFVGIGIGTVVSWFTVSRSVEESLGRPRPPWIPAVLTTVSGAALLLIPLVETGASGDRASGSPTPRPIASGPASSTSEPGPTPSAPVTAGASAPPSAQGGSSQPAAVTRYQGPTSVTYGGDPRSLDGLPTSNNSPFDLQLASSDVIFPLSNAKLAQWTGSQPPSRQDCLTTVATQSQPQITARPGVQFCVQTNDKRFAYVKVTDSDSQTARLAVIVWEKPS